MEISYTRDKAIEIKTDISTGTFNAILFKYKADANLHSIFESNSGNVLVIKEPYGNFGSIIFEILESEKSEAN